MFDLRVCSESRILAESVGWHDVTTGVRAWSRRLRDATQAPDARLRNEP
jgi:hypothetical protein